MRDVLERFEEKYIPVTNTGCWLWTGTLLGKNKLYGQMWYGKKKEKAHRISYELFNGPITDGLYVLHTCDVRSCVNPKHLYLGTQLQNMHDAYARGRKSRYDEVANLRRGNPKLGGHANNFWKLTADQALTISHSQEKSAILAQRFGVASSYINRLKRKARSQTLLDVNS